MKKILVFALLALSFWASASSAADTSAFAASDDALTADRVMGNPAAPVKIVEYSSLTCPHCALFDKETLPKLKTDYIDTGKIYFISRDYPLDGPALEAAMMARCAAPDRYFALIDMLFQSQETWVTAPDPVAAMTPMGRFSGLSDAQIKSCFDNQHLQDFVVAERKTAEDKYKVNSTPTFIFNDGAEQFSGAQPYDKFKTTIDSLSAKK